MASDLTAPGYDPEAVGLPWHRRAWAQGLGYYLPSVLFLAIPVLVAWTRMPLAVFALVALNVVALGGTFLGTTLVSHRGIGFRVLWCVLIAALVLVLAAQTGQLSLAAYYVPYVTVPVANLLPWRWSRIAIPVIGVLGFVAALISKDYFAFSLAIFGVVMSFAMAQGVQSERRQRLLTREQERNAALAVAAERERIGRDLHDILGHSLTAIAVKSELAGKLVERDPAAAKAQIDEVTSVARQALADVRATASNMRQVRVATEIASARSVLAAADVKSEAPSSLPAYDDATAELFGYVVREGVTNVVRHAQAHRCTITADESHVSVADDGRGFTTSSTGSGLAGLRDRVEAAGAHLDVESSRGGTVITCTLPKETA